MKSNPSAFFRLAGLSLLAVGLSGCLSIEHSGGKDMKSLTLVGSRGEPRDHVVITNYGYYLFNLIPLACGNKNAQTAWSPCSFFRDDVTLANAQSILIDAVKSDGCQLSELESTVQSTCFFSFIPYIQNSLGILWYREVQLSAVLVKAPKANTDRRMIDPLTKEADSLLTNLSEGGIQ